jgi:hypothetical protein
MLADNFTRASELMNEVTVLKGQLAHAENAEFGVFIMDAEGAWTWAGAFFGVLDKPLSLAAAGSVCHGLRTKIEVLNRRLESLGVKVVRESDTPTDPALFASPLPTEPEAEKEAA